ncbi:hypothetical protein [Leptospira mtsangambouensis]|uniref:hypothetical protein n=1 Tax=Leptospira mtsangambouensis TaxID=2484912 RepID=UPI001EEA6C00|nr:hypothetical protein [Leptospira mtsangambouensis]MCG6141354.1 hypothetical protein [Leptospira mtsangambouensis]
MVVPLLVEVIRLQEVEVIRLQEVVVIRLREVEVEVQAEEDMGVEGIETCHGIKKPHQILVRFIISGSDASIHFVTQHPSPPTVLLNSFLVSKEFPEPVEGNFYNIQRSVTTILTKVIGFLYKRR